MMLSNSSSATLSHIYALRDATSKPKLLSMDSISVSLALLVAMTAATSQANTVLDDFLTLDSGQAEVTASASIHNTPQHACCLSTQASLYATHARGILQHAFEPPVALLTPCHKPRC